MNTRRIYFPSPMKNTLIKGTSQLFLQGFIVFIGIGTLAALLWEPQVEGVNANATNFEIYFQDPFLALVYAGSIPFFIALYQAFTILEYVGKNKVFSKEVVHALRTIQFCAIAIIGFVAIEEIVIMLNHGDDDAAGAIAMGIVITFGSIVVATAAAVFTRILQSAVEMKSENDLIV